VDCRFSGDEPLPALENGVSLHLYYIAQEAVLNAAKHGNAKNVVISLMHARDRFTLAVKDDGLGFPWPGTHSTGMGIRIMHYRARVIGANLDLKSQAGHGTQVTCILYASSSETLEETNYDRRSQ
jgi:signal transduction histidine kinase